jgi:HK97 family phage major capsid protein/HK97 family phage prohead protease
MEFRQVPITATQAPLKVEGYAVVFDKPAQVGNFTEIILREALNGTDISDVALFYNHDTRQIPLARTPNTLSLTVDETGLKFSAILPNTEEGRAVYESVKRGDLRGCSFAFKVAEGGEEWQGDNRTIKNIEKIYECSICTFPAYTETSVQARQQQKGFSEMTTTNNTNSTNTENNQETFGSNAQVLLRNVAGLDTLDTSKHFDADNVLDTAEYRTAFFKQLQGKTLTPTEKAAMTVARESFEKRSNEFNTSTNSAALIPTETLNEIISKARTQGGLISECRGFSVPSGVSIPVATPKEKAAWHTEGAAVESEKIDSTNVTFNGYEILKIMSLSLKTQSMTVSAFESYLVEELRSCVMETIEDAIINGTGAGQGTGIMTVFDTDNTITLANPLSYASVTASISKLGRGYARGAKFAMNNKSLWTTFYTITDNNARPLFVQDLQNQGIGKILGYDVVIDDNIPDNTIIFGNFKYMSYNLPQGIVIESSRESSFKSGLIDYRAIAIADCKPLLKEAFIKIQWTE